MQKTNLFIQSNRENFVSELIELLKIPSISADPAYKNEVLKCAERLAENLSRIGIDKVEISDLDKRRILKAIDLQMVQKSIMKCLIFFINNIRKLYL